MGYQITQLKITIVSLGLVIAEIVGVRMLPGLVEGGMFQLDVLLQRTLRPVHTLAVFYLALVALFNLLGSASRSFGFVLL